MTAPLSRAAAERAEQLFVAAAEATAPLLCPLAQAHGRTYVTERYELQPAFKAELQRVASTADPRAAVSPRLKADLRRHYTGIGPFDVSLEWPGAVAFGELKSGPDVNSTTNCVWDAPKLAVMVRTREAVSGHLIACAPASLWTPTTAGLELFFDGEWDMLDLRERHSSWWRKWEREGYMPRRIPAHLRTTALAGFTFGCGDERWRLGVARVEPLGESWLDWPPFYPDRWHDHGDQPATAHAR